MSVSQRLAIGFAAMLATVLVAGGVVLEAQQRSDRAEQAFQQTWLPRERAAERLERSLMRVAIAVRSYVDAGVNQDAYAAVRQARERWRRGWWAAPTRARRDCGCSRTGGGAAGQRRCWDRYRSGLLDLRR